MTAPTATQLIAIAAVGTSSADLAPLHGTSPGMCTQGWPWPSCAHRLLVRNTRRKQADLLVAILVALLTIIAIIRGCGVLQTDIAAAVGQVGA